MLKKNLLILIISFGTFVFAQEYIPPQVRGGQAAFEYLLENEMYYPPGLLAEKEEGKVKLLFSLDEEGAVLARNVLEGAKEAFITEASRLSQYVIWEPAFREGKAVAGEAILEISFKSGKYKRIRKQRGFDRPPEVFQPADSSYLVFDKKALDQPVEVSAPQGYSGMADFIRKNLAYPELALKRGLSGNVLMDMVVETSGRITNLRIVQSVGAGCDEEAIRLVKMLRFKPGIRAGTYVRSNMQFMISFALPDEAGYRYFPTQQGGSMQ